MSGSIGDLPMDCWLLYLLFILSFQESSDLKLFERAPLADPEWTPIMIPSTLIGEKANDGKG
jgi:hypothetical protein